MAEKTFEEFADEFIVEALVKTRIVLSEYRALTPGRGLPHADAELVKAVVSYSEITPKIYLVDHDAGRHFRSKIEVYRRTKQAVIVVLTKNISSCWQRYGLVKELAHLIIDTKDSTITANIGIDDALANEDIKIQVGVEAGMSLIKKLINPPRLSQGLKAAPDLMYISEKITEICAEDLLFPVDEREGYLVRLELSADLNELHHIATELMLPEKVVEKLLDRKHFDGMYALYKNHVFPRFDAP
jgi:hypothetical protein